MIISLPSVAKLIIDIVILSNLIDIDLIFQFGSFVFIRKVERVIRMYMQIVIIVVTIIKVGNKIKLFLTRAWIVNHLGKNPSRGGIPLNDKKFRINSIFVMGL